MEERLYENTEKVVICNSGTEDLGETISSDTLILDF